VFKMEPVEERLPAQVDVWHAEYRRLT
jgi:hypothetical protein